MSDLLKRYGGGDYAAVTTSLAAITDFKGALRQLDRIAVPWIRSGASEDAFRRRLIVAGFAIETAHAGLDQWEDARYFVEWACILLRAGGLPKPPERAWHLAAVALAQGAHDPDLLANDPFRTVRGARAIDHLRHSVFRFPDDDRLRLAGVATSELRTLGSDPKHPRVSSLEAGRRALQRTPFPDEPTPVEVFDRAVAKQLLANPTPAHQLVVFAARRSTWLWDLADQWKALGQRDSIRTEATIHLANTYLRLDRPDLALDALRSVPLPEGDSALLYLVHYLAGRAEEIRGDREAAERSYRAAVAAVPRAQSASMALATLLFLSDSRTEAFEVTADMFAAGPPVSDPWRDYQANDFRQWPTRVRELRDAYQR